MDTTLTDNGLWERATFTVPEDTLEEQVQFKADVYMARFGIALEHQGFTVREMLRPRVSMRGAPTEQGRRRYDIFAFVSRLPVVTTMDIPDALVPEMLQKGMQLK